MRMVPEPCVAGPNPASTVQLPTFADAAPVKPDLVSAHPGGMAGYFAYPASPVQRVSQPPLAGSSVKAVTSSFDPVAPGVNDNPLWQQVNKALGGNLDIIYTPAAVDFDAVLAAIPDDYDGDYMIEIDHPSVDSRFESHQISFEWALHHLLG